HDHIHGDEADGDHRHDSARRIVAQRDHATPPLGGGPGPPARLLTQLPCHARGGRPRPSVIIARAVSGAFLFTLLPEDRTMKSYSAEQIHNVVLISHGGAGKTSLAEALLYVSGAISRLGRVEEGNTVSDYDVDEVKRRT